MKGSKWHLASFGRWVVLLAGIILVFGMAVTLPTGAALAASTTPTPPARDYSALTQAYQHEQSLLGQQQGNLDKASGEVSKIQNLISQAQSKGVDTSALQAALANFQAQLSTAQGSHNTAASILSAHNGFDDSGKVTDPATARQTVQDARQALMDAHTVLSQAVHDLGAAVKAWREANKDKLQNQDLQKAYQSEQKWLGIQSDNLNKANNAAGKVQDLINKAQAKGLDTSALQAALSAFQSQLSTAQGSHATAANILSAHNGFDDSGNVTDQAAAAQTVKDAHQALQDARGVLLQATQDLHSAVKAWEEANKDKLQDQDLQKAYQGEQNWLTTQQGNLGKANDLATKVQDLISQAQAKGLDTSVLSSALSTFQSQLATARASDTTAANILSAHNGFDGSGNVTDQAAAAQTVKDARQALQDAHNVLVQSVGDLKKAVEQWRDQNHMPTATPAATGL